MAYSTFMGLNTALRGLLAHQASMDVTGHNITNINTEGYSRQRAELVASKPLSTPAINATTPGQIGTGVEVARFERLRDQYIDRNLRNQFGAAMSADTLVGQLSQVEATFNEPSDSGISALMQRFFSSLEDVAAHPDDMSARQTFAAASDALATAFNRVAAELAGPSGLIPQINARLADTATEIDGISARIAQLNSLVLQATQSGMQANDLLDERDRLMDQLATKINYDYTVNPSTQEVTIRFPTSPGPPTTYLDIVDPALVNGWTNITTADFTTAHTNGTLTGGSVYADQELSVNVIPGYMTRLDTLVNSFVTDMNATHNLGFDLTGAAGTDIFTGATAATIQLAGPPTIMDDPARIAAASSWGGTGEPGNGNNAARMISDPVTGRSVVRAALGGNTWEGYYNATVSLVGTDSLAAQQDLANRSLLVQTLEGRRAEVSGVSLDEEMSNMLRFQHAYNAAARVMTAVDDALDTLINRMGRVGL